MYVMTQKSVKTLRHPYPTYKLRADKTDTTQKGALDATSVQKPLTTYSDVMTKLQENHVQNYYMTT